MVIETKTKKSETLSSSIYELMRKDILEGRLRAGEKLTMTALQMRYSAGNSPIREALNRLIPEGLVEREEQKGFRVQKLTQADLAEVTKMRCWLEDIAIRESIRLGDSKWEESIVLAHHRLIREPRHLDEAHMQSNPKWEQAHDQFHRVLLEACDSKWLLNYCLNMHSLTERYRRNGLMVDYRSRDSKREHEDIMNAAIHRDADLASKLLQDHSRLTADHIINSLTDSE